VNGSRGTGEVPLKDGPRYIHSPLPFTGGRRQTLVEMGADSVVGWQANFIRWDGVETARRLSIWSESGNSNPYPHNPKRLGTITFPE
jgi:hypothetical protein